MDLRDKWPQKFFMLFCWNWTKVPLGDEEVHLLTVYLEPGLEAFVGKRADTVISLAKGIIRQDPAAKIILGGDLNG